MAQSDSPFATFLDPTKTAGQPPAGVGSSTLPASFGGPVPAGQTPPPGVNTQVVYTDASGKGYNPNELAAAMQNPAFMADPLNARTRDILPQYATVQGTPMAPTGSSAAPTAATPTTGVPANVQDFGATTGINDPRGSAFFDTLMANVNAVPNVDPNDPTIKAETDAFAANRTRSNRDYLSAAAEKGGTGANTDAIARSLAESGGQATGAFQAGLMDQERQARRGQIQNMLSLGGSFLSQEQSLALQKELADMNLSENSYQFDQNMAFQTSPFAAGASA